MVEKTYIILQARMNSERLPGKVMKLIGGIPMIGILIKRLKKSDLPIILATSSNIENDVLVEYAKSWDVQVYRGSENNVLERYYFAAKSVDAQTIIRVTGDNPLLDGELLRDSVNYYCSLNDERTYLSTGLSHSFPLGISVEIFSFSLLEEAYINAIHLGEFEHVTPYMHQNKPGNINIIKIARKENRYHYRLTVDTPDDFFLNQKLIEEFQCDQLNMDEIIKILDENEELQQLNHSIIQKKWDE
jgi:spore coat polysaccharide biosynthesis protein SpsF